MTLLVFGVLAMLAWWRGEMLFLRASSARERARSRELDIREREVALNERVKAETKEPEPIPPDLMALVMDESEPFAQDDMLKVIRDAYAQSQDWNTARRAVGRAAFRTPGLAGTGPN